MTLTRFHSIGLVALAACSSSTSAPPPIGATPKPVAATEVTVEISSVVLGDDCGGGARPAPPPTATKLAVAPSAPTMEPDAKRAPRDSDADCARGQDCNVGRMACEQTSMQLALVAPAGAQPTTITIKKVELLDGAGAVVDVLTARLPTRWTDTSYVAR